MRDSSGLPLGPRCPARCRWADPKGTAITSGSAQRGARDDIDIVESISNVPYDAYTAGPRALSPLGGAAAPGEPGRPAKGSPSRSGEGFTSPGAAQKAAGPGAGGTGIGPGPPPKCGLDPR